MASGRGPLPAVYKPIAHHLKTAKEYDSRDAVVAYYCKRINDDSDL